ncbi:MAG: hypothetical protein ABSE47_05655 [Acidimicrobiales bacterium]|jgi:hypothetical protein
MGYTRQQWHDAMVRSAGADERGRTAAISLSALAGAVILVLGWNSGHIRHPVLVVIGAAILVAAVVQFALFVHRRLRGSQ